MYAAQLTGLALGNAGTTYLRVGAGAARDAANGVDLVLTAPLVKSFANLFSPGANQGCRSAGADPIVGSAWYFVFLIGNGVGDVDVLADPSPVPTLPGGYTTYRRVGFVRSAGTHGVIATVNQQGDRFWFSSSPMDAVNLPVGAVPVVVPLTVPQGIPLEAEVTALLTGSTANYLLLYPASISSMVVSPAGSSGVHAQETAAPCATVRVACDNSGAIKAQSDVGVTMNLWARAVYDRRGQDGGA